MIRRIHCKQYDISNFERIKSFGYLIQFSGSPSQSVLQRKRSQDSQPIGGVLANPFSKHFVVFGIKTMITKIANNLIIVIELAIAPKIRSEGTLIVFFQQIIY